VSGPAGAHSARGRLQQSVINPVVRLAWNLGIPIPGDALLETTGRRTRLPRRTPVCDGQRILSQASLARRLCLSASKAQNTNPLTIRVDLDSE
jgi:hypothetical protein